MEDIRLGIEEMDVRHDDFVSLLRKLQTAPKEEFLTLFQQMVEHTKEHFAFEEALMNEKNYYGLHEHMLEHKNLLDEMMFYFEKAAKMSPFGYSYINDYAHEKFKRHVLNIDSQFTMFLKEQARVIRIKA